MDELSMASRVERFYQSLYHFALSLARNEVVAADLTQETYYLWAAKGHQLRDATKVKSWLFTTLHREFLRGQRHSNRFPHHETGHVEHELPIISPTVVNDLDSIAVMQALQRVDEHYRVPLAMFYLEDFSYKEIAEALELPTGTVMSRLSRGKAQLRALLGEAATGAESKIVPLSNAQARANG
ncbi:MAG: RNA polymerase sigma factor [Verrucomicrobiales bacterium]|nr:RNA polymerase sigma factor [Verrucomicrobiales bacterium]